MITNQTSLRNTINSNQMLGVDQFYGTPNVDLLTMSSACPTTFDNTSGAANNNNNVSTCSPPRSIEDDNAAATGMQNRSASKDRVEDSLSAANKRSSSSQSTTSIKDHQDQDEELATYQSRMLPDKQLLPSEETSMVANNRKQDVRGRNQKLAGVFYNQRRGCYDQGMILSSESVQVQFKSCSSAPNFADMSCVEQMQFSPETTAQEGYKDKSGSFNFLTSPVDTQNDLQDAVAVTDQRKRREQAPQTASLSVVTEDKRDDSKQTDFCTTLPLNEQIQNHLSEELMDLGARLMSSGGRQSIFNNKIEQHSELQITEFKEPLLRLCQQHITAAGIKQEGESNTSVIQQPSLPQPQKSSEADFKKWLQNNSTSLISNQLGGVAADNSQHSFMNPTVFQLKETSLRLQQQQHSASKQESSFQQNKSAVVRKAVTIPTCVIESYDSSSATQTPSDDQIQKRRSRGGRKADTSTSPPASQDALVYGGNSNMLLQPDFTSKAASKKPAPTANVPLRVLVAETKKQQISGQLEAGGQPGRLSTSAGGAVQTNTGDYNYMPTTTMADELNKTTTQLQMEEDEDDDEGVLKLADMDENIPLSGQHEDMFSGFNAQAKVIADPSQKSQSQNQSFDKVCPQQPSLLKPSQSTHKPTPIVMRKPMEDEFYAAQDQMMDDDQGSGIAEEASNCSVRLMCSGSSNGSQRMVRRTDQYIIQQQQQNQMMSITSEQYMGSGCSYNLVPNMASPDASITSSSRSVTVTVSAANLNQSSCRFQQQLRESTEETILSCNQDSRSTTSNGGKNSVKNKVPDRQIVGTNPQQQQTFQTAPSLLNRSSQQTEESDIMDVADELIMCGQKQATSATPVLGTEEDQQQYQCSTTTVNTEANMEETSESDEAHTLEPRNNYATEQIVKKASSMPLADGIGEITVRTKAAGHQYSLSSDRASEVARFATTEDHEEQQYYVDAQDAYGLGMLEGQHLEIQNQHQLFSGEGVAVSPEPTLPTMTEEQKLAQFFRKFGQVEVISEEQEEQVTITSNYSPDSCDRRDNFGQPIRAPSKTQVSQWYSDPLEAELSADQKRRASRMVLTTEDLLRIQRRDHNKGQKSAEDCNSDHGRRGHKNNAPPMLQALKELDKCSQKILDSAMQQAPKSCSKSQSVQSVRIQQSDPKFKKSFKRQYSSASDKSAKSERMPSSKAYHTQKAAQKTASMLQTQRVERIIATQGALSLSKRSQEARAGPSLISSSQQKDFAQLQKTSSFLQRGAPSSFISNSSTSSISDASSKNTSNCNNSQTTNMKTPHYLKHAKKYANGSTQPSFQKTRSMQYFSGAKQIKLMSSTSQKLPTIAWKSTCSRPGLTSIEVLDTASTNNSIALDTNTMIVHSSKPKMNSSRNHNSPSKTAKANYSSIPTKTYKMLVSSKLHSSKHGQTLIAPSNSCISTGRGSMTKSAEHRKNQGSISPNRTSIIHPVQFSGAGKDLAKMTPSPKKVRNHVGNQSQQLVINHSKNQILASSSLSQPQGTFLHTAAIKAITQRKAAQPLARQQKTAASGNNDLVLQLKLCGPPSSAPAPAAQSTAAQRSIQEAAAARLKTTKENSQPMPSGFAVKSPPLHWIQAQKLLKVKDMNAFTAGVSCRALSFRPGQGIASSTTTNHFPNGSTNVSPFNKIHSTTPAKAIKIGGQRSTNKGALTTHGIAGSHPLITASYQQNQQAVAVSTKVTRY